MKHYVAPMLAMPKPVPEVKTCAACCEYELTVQWLREAYQLMVDAMAAADRTKPRR